MALTDGYLIKADGIPAVGEQHVVDAGSIVTSIGATGSDSAFPTEQAVREGIDTTIGPVTTLTSSSNQLVINPVTAKQMCYHILTENTELQVPSLSGLSSGEGFQIDLFIKVDSGGSYTFSINSSFKSAGATLPTPSTDADALDHYVIIGNKDLNIVWIGLAFADIS